MYKKRNIRLFVSLVILVIITASVYVLTYEGSLTSKEEVNFKVDDFNVVSRLAMTSATDTVNLSYNGSRWRVNDSYDADRSLIDLIFATLQQVKAKRPVANAISDSIAMVLKQSGVRVSLFDKEKLLKTFYAGGNAQKNQAYFMEDATEATPHVMAIPGYRVYASGIFELDKNEWRDKYVFNFNWRNLQRVEVIFSGKPSQDFSISMIDAYFGIEGMPTADTSRLNSFLDNVSLLTVDKYLPEKPHITDSLLLARSEIRIVVKDVSNRPFILALYLPVRDKRWVLGLINDTEPALFDIRKIQEIIRPKSYFLKE